MAFISYAQNYEDVMLWRALKHVDHGFYVDVGANDPIHDSVTYAFYKQAWRGINLEPAPEFYDRLCQERPFDINLPVAAGSMESELHLYVVPETGLSTLDPKIVEEILLTGRTYSERLVTVTPLNKIFEQYLHEPVHFLKIDVEGYEEEVLHGLDLKRWRPWIILVEATKPGSSELGLLRWEPLIVDSGYQFVYFDGINRFYLADEHAELQFAFLSPPNVFDGFILARELKQNETIRLQSQKNGEIETANNEVLIELHAVQDELDLQRAGLNSAYEKIDKMAAELGLTHARNYELIAEQCATHSKNYELVSELIATHAKNYELTAEVYTFQDRNKELSAKLDAVNVKNDELTSMLGAVHASNVQLAEEISFHQKKTSVLILELDAVRARIDSLSLEMNSAQVKIGQVHSELGTVRGELDKVYHSRSYRITAPMRAVFGAARVQRERIRNGKNNIKWSYIIRIEPMFHRRVIQIRQVSILSHLKSLVKTRYPHFWQSIRKFVLPSYVTRLDPKIISTQTSPEFNQLINQTEVELSEEERYFWNLFEHEVAIRNKKTLR